MRNGDTYVRGATLATGGERLGGDLASGFFVQPTVFSNVTPEMTIAREEIFGPVISVLPFDGYDDALQLANATTYGLGGAVWTRDMNTAPKRSNPTACRIPRTDRVRWRSDRR
jgi:aldehyde dehydrogenase (NAD+)